jgi:hypothetical protein
VQKQQAFEAEMAANEERVLHIIATTYRKSKIFSFEETRDKNVQCRKQ